MDKGCLIDSLRLDRLPLFSNLKSYLSPLKCPHIVVLLCPQSLTCAPSLTLLVTPSSQALVYSNFRPSPLWLDSYLRASAALVNEGRYTPMQLVQTLRSLSRLKCPPGAEWMEGWLEAMEEALPRATIGLCSQASSSIHTSLT